MSRANRDAKLREHCRVLAELVGSMRVTYESAETPQKAFLETVVGAGLWYLPKPPTAWTGLISLRAVEAYHPLSGVANPRLSEEHVYPRKVAARLLILDIELTPERLYEQFVSHYGRVHFITPEENKAVQRYQRADVFTSPEQVYVDAGVSLRSISPDNLKQVKRRDQGVIETVLSQWNKVSEGA